MTSIWIFIFSRFLEKLVVKWLAMHIVTIDQPIGESETGFNPIRILAMILIHMIEPEGGVLAILRLLLLLLLLLLLHLSLRLKWLRVDLETSLEAGAESRIGLRVGHGLGPALRIGLRHERRRHMSTPMLTEADLGEGVGLRLDVGCGGSERDAAHLAVVVRTGDLGGDRSLLRWWSWKSFLELLLLPLGEGGGPACVREKGLRGRHELGLLVLGLLVLGLAH